MSHKDNDKLKHFKEIEIHRRNQYRVDTQVYVSGRSSFADNFVMRESSSEVETKYSGDVPKKYYRHTDGDLKSQSGLREVIIRELEGRLSRVLSAVYMESELY